MFKILKLTEFNGNSLNTYALSNKSDVPKYDYLTSSNRIEKRSRWLMGRSNCEVVVDIPN